MKILKNEDGSIDLKRVAILSLVGIFLVGGFAVAGTGEDNGATFGIDTVQAESNFGETEILEARVGMDDTGGGWDMDPVIAHFEADGEHEDVEVGDSFDKVEVSVQLDGDYHDGDTTEGEDKTRVFITLEDPDGNKILDDVEASNVDAQDAGSEDPMLVYHWENINEETVEEGEYTLNIDYEIYAPE